VELFDLGNEESMRHNPESGIMPTPPFPPIERITRFPAAGILAAGELEIIFAPFILFLYP